jgi:hypothetical protein
MSNSKSRQDFLAAIRPGAEEVGTWRYLWREHRLTLGRALFEFFRDRPLLAVFLGVFILSPSWLGVVNMILALLVGQFWNELMGQLGVLANQYKFLHGGLDTLTQNDPQLRVERHKVSAYLPEFEYNDISMFLVETFQKMLPIASDNPMTLDDQLEVFAIDSDQSILVNVSSYPAPLRKSFIIFDHKPEECGPFQRFTILHEVGHIVIGGLVKSSYFSRHGFKTMLFSLGMAFLVFQLESGAWIPILAFYLLGYWERLQLSYNANVRDEIICDAFALSYLPSSDVAVLATVADLPSRLRDTTLSEKHNRQRIKSLSEGLALRTSNPDDPAVMDDFFDDKAINQKPNFFKVLLMVGCLGAVALYVSVKPGVTLALVVVFIILVLAFFFSHVWFMSNLKSLNERVARYEAAEAIR